MMPQTAVGPGWLFPIGPLGSSREQREQTEADLGASCVIVIGQRPASKRRSRVCMAPSGTRSIQSPGSGAVRPRAVLSLAAVGAGPFARLCHHGICRSQQSWFLWCLRWWERRRGQMVCPNLAAAGTRRMSGRDGQATRLESRSAPKLWWTSAPNRCVVRTLQQICSFPDADHVGFGVSNRLQSVSGRSQLHQRLEMIDDFKFAHPPHRPETTRWSPSSISPGTNLELGPTKVFFFGAALPAPTTCVRFPTYFHHFRASHPKPDCCCSLHSVDPVLMTEFCSAALRCSKRRAVPSHNLHQTVFTAPHNLVTQPRGIATVHLVLCTPTHTRKTRQHAVGSMGAKSRSAVGSESMTSRRTRERGEGG